MEYIIMVYKNNKVFEIIKYYCANDRKQVAILQINETSVCIVD